MCAYFQWTCWDSDPGPPPCKGGALPAELQALYPMPSLMNVIAGFFRFIWSWSTFQLPTDCGRTGTFRPVPSLGGDPAADSPTATLLRLNPPCKAQIRTPPKEALSFRPYSGGLTGGVCKEQGRIHRVLLKRDYYGFQLHEGELQPSIRTKIGFRRFPSPFGVDTHCTNHCSSRVARDIRGILTYRCPFLPPL